MIVSAMTAPCHVVGWALSASIVMAPMMRMLVAYVLLGITVSVVHGMPQVLLDRSRSG
jgi:hypothetical protein